MEPLSTKRSRRDRNMRKSSRVSYMTQVMKPQIWKFFPEDLFKDVLARLPFATVIRFRTVCHQWNNLITSQSFSHYRAQVSQANPWFYLTFGDGKYNATLPKNNTKATYDPFTKRWYYSNTFKILALPVSSAGGLVCSFDYFDQNLYVCNPLTKSVKKLPTGSIMRQRHLGMTMNKSGGYRVLRFSHREYEIYDSVTENWGHLGSIPEYIVQPDSYICNPVSIDDTIYFKHIGQERIVSCNTSTGVWAQHFIQVPLPSFFLRLVESDGRIMLVGMLRENDARFVCIWEVQKVTFLLKEVDRFPLSESYGIVRGLTCWGNNGLLLCCLRLYTMYHIVTYNIATRKWVKVRFPYGRKLVEKNYVFGTAFEPCLTAIP
ncbi:Galactose oxidase/kelch repeat superfamily protein [Trifolium repens]|nr:Galactose oxidase/kelch repeat superfamily protein [Trifolium repens]